VLRSLKNLPYFTIGILFHRDRAPGALTVSPLSLPFAGFALISAPWVSVVVPVHNGARFLATALESVLGQADTRVEILVCDDGSTDGSQAIIERFARDSRIRPLDGPKRGNWVANTNAAVLRARGDLITFLHQDDVWLAGRLQALHRAVTRFPEASVWLGPTRYIDANGRAVGTLRLPFGARDTVVAPDKFF
jgi:glycosyltransferase involved in cell wall biosynthesis